MRWLLAMQRLASGCAATLTVRIAVSLTRRRYGTHRRTVASKAMAVDLIMVAVMAMPQDLLRHRMCGRSGIVLLPQASKRQATAMMTANVRYRCVCPSSSAEATRPQQQEAQALAAAAMLMQAQKQAVELAVAVAVVVAAAFSRSS